MTTTDETKTSSVTVTRMEVLTPLPSFADTVIVAVPLPTAWTVPPLTVATLELLLRQLTDGLVALYGQTVAVTYTLSPFSKIRFPLSKVIMLTGTAFDVTVTVSESLRPLPSAALAVMVAVPTP